MRFGRSGKKSVTDSQRAVAYRGPAGRKPDFSSSDEGLLTERTESTVVADCDGQLLLAGWVVLHWNTHTRVLWDITAGCTGGRRLFFAFHDSGSVHAQCYLGCHLSQPGFFWSEFTIGPMWAIPMDIAPRFAGSASGLMNTGSALAAIVSPLVFGYIIDRTNNWELPFLGSIGLLLLGSIVAFWMKPGEKLSTAQLRERPAVSVVA